MASVLPLMGPPRSQAFIPRLGASDDEALDFVNRVINQQSSFRRGEMARMARNLWFKLGRQWIRPSGHLRADSSGNHLFSFEEVYRNSASAWGRHVSNRIGKAVDHEAARLVRQEYEPAIHPSTLGRSNNPEVEAASRLAKDWLIYDLREMQFPEIRDALAFDLMVAGTCVARSWWDETHTDLVPISTEDPAKCPACGKVFASRRVPAVFAASGMPSAEGMIPMTWPDSVEPDEGGSPLVKMNLCPFCQDQRPLEDYLVSREEAEGGRDVFDRAMGELVPRGTAEIEALPVWYVYPENGGVGVEPAQCRMWGVKMPRSMDWVRMRLGDAAEDIQPDKPNDLMKLHPILGDAGYSGPNNFAPVGDRDIYPDHVAVSEVAVDPMPLPGLELGRFIVEIGGKVRINGPLCIEVDGPDGRKRKVPRVLFGAARFSRVPGMFWGRTPVDDAISPQQRLNELDSQMIDIRERFAPFVALPPDVWVNERRDEDGAARQVEIEGLENRKLSDFMFPGQIVTGNAYLQERNAIISDLEEILLPQDVEEGRAKANETATGMIHLSEQIAINRAPRERRLADLHQRLWSHHMELTWALRREEAEVELGDSSGPMERKAYRGTNLMGQTKVRISQRPGTDNVLIVREATKEALEMGLYRADSQVAIDRILENLGAPKNVNEDSALQIRRADQAWLAFKETGTVDPIDPSIDDHWIWWQILGKHWQEEDAQQGLRDLGWMTSILPALAGWERGLREAEAADAEQRAFYSGVPPEQWKALYDQGLEAHQSLSQASQARDQMAAGMGMAPGAPLPPAPVQPPLGGQFLPDAIEQRIYLLWMRRLLSMTPPPVAAGDSGGIIPWLRLKARMEGHKLMHERKIAEAQVQPEAAAPGGAQGPAGQQAVPGMPATLPVGAAAQGPGGSVRGG